MRIEETKSKSGKDELIYEVRIGFNELQVINDCLRDVKKRTPEAIEIMSFRRRINDMINKMAPIIIERRKYNKGK